jgi:hypothetical protein
VLLVPAKDRARHPFVTIEGLTATARCGASREAQDVRIAELQFLAAAGSSRADRLFLRTQCGLPDPSAVAG